MPHAQRQRDLIASLHLESLFDQGDLGAFGPGNDKVALSARREASASQRRLRDLLCQVGGTVCGAALPDVGQSAASCGRAAANIETWLAYLPRDCVRAMVGGGWHLNT